MAAILTVARRTESKVDRLTASHAKLNGIVTTRFGALDKFEDACRTTQTGFWKEINCLKTWTTEHNGMDKGIALTGDRVSRWGRLVLGGGFLLLAFLTGDATDAIDALKAWLSGP